MRPYCSIGQLAFAFVGCVIFAVLAVVAKFFFNSLISDRLHLNLPLTPNATSGITSFSVWKDIPFPVHDKFYFFHVENPDEVIQLGEKPILTQVGPFAYNQRRHKVSLKFSPDRSKVSYKELSFYHFNAKESQYPENHTVRVLNVPLLTVLGRAKSLPSFVRFILNRLVSQTKSKLFIERSVHELLWGYEDPLLVELKRLLPKDIPLTKFGWFMKQNGSDQGRFEVFTGSDGNLSRYLNIVRWNSQPRMNLWPPGQDSSCNSFRGSSDGSAFGPFLKSTQKLRVFNPRMCRGAFESVFDGVETQRDVRMLRFHMDNQTFGNASTNPSNFCFCSTFANDSDTPICPPMGTLNISACSFGAPVFLSQPHFLNADIRIGRRFSGLSPIPENHDSFFYIEPTTGITADAQARFQLNGFVENLKAFPKIFRNIGNGLIFPVLWLEEAATMDDRTFDSVIRFRVVDKIRLVDASVALLIGLAVFLLLSTILLVWQRWHFKRNWDVIRERLIPVDDSSSVS